MNLLSWKCWRLGNLRTVNALKEVTKREDPKVVFLMETKSNREWMIMVRINGSSRMDFLCLAMVQVEVWRYYGRRRFV